MKNINTKKLALVSFVSIFLGIGTLLLAAYKRQHLSETYPMKDLLFTYRVMGRAGVILILLGIVTLLFALTRIILHKVKQLQSTDENNS